MRRVPHAVLACVLLLTAGMFLVLPPIPQDPAYHRLADQRVVLGVPNGLNVLSNIPFGLAGLLGLFATFDPKLRRPAFLDPWERWPYAALFAGASLTAVGSAYYHLAPDNGRLVWDRLPIAIGFMGLLTAVAGERIQLSLAKALFVPLLALGAASVLYWNWGELRGRGDLRPYALVQFGTLVFTTLLLLLYPARYSGAGYLFAGIGIYAIAKAFELADRQVFSLGQIVSGHTLKHVVATGGVGCVAVMLRRRRLRAPGRVEPGRYPN